MKAAVVYGKGDIRIEEYKTPTAGEGEIVVRTKVSGICATDIKTLLGQGLPKDLPTILGHEVVGEVSETGEGVSAYQILGRCHDDGTIGPQGKIQHRSCNTGTQIQDGKIILTTHPLKMLNKFYFLGVV